MPNGTGDPSIDKRTGGNVLYEGYRREFHGDRIVEWWKLNTRTRSRWQDLYDEVFAEKDSIDEPS